MNKKIAIIADNSVDYVKKIIEIWNNGDCVVLIDWRLPWSKIKLMLEEIGISSCIITQHLENELQTTKYEWELISESRTIQCINEECYRLYRSNYSEEDAIILFSSGTTGKTKGIVLSFRAIETNADLVLNYMRLSKNDAMYIVKSMAHSSTVICELLVSLKSKTKLYVAPTVVPIGFIIKNIIIYNVTVICMNPTLLMLFSSYVEKKGIGFKKLKSIYVSGAILSSSFHKHVQQLLKGIPVYNVYGLTECGPRVSAQIMGKSWKYGSVGKTLNGILVEIRNKNGEILGESKRGCIWVYTPSLFTRYVKEDKIIDERGFFCTNDIGYMERGELFITGRADNMIISGAHNIFPEEIEKTINQIDEIIENVVIGIEDNLYGKKLVCLYVLSKQMTVNIRLFCKEHLAVYEIPHEFIPVKKIPKNINGKIDRQIAITLYKGNKLEEMLHFGN